MERQDDREAAMARARASGNSGGVAADSAVELPAAFLRALRGALTHQTAGGS